MLVLCHLFIGALIGLLIYRWKGERLAVPVAALAAILPDVVDKPLGHFLLQGTLDNGRIFGHGLLFAGIVVALAAALSRQRHRYLVLALLAGLLSHLALDAMWSLPTTLFWPLLGPFPRESYPDYFGSSIVHELTAPSEYAFLGGLGIIAAEMWRDRLGPGLRRAGDALLRYRRVVYGALLVVGVTQLAFAILGLIEGRPGAADELIPAMALLLGGMVLRSLEPLESDRARTERPT